VSAVGTDDRAAWARQRRRAVEAHGAAEERRRAAEADQARQLVAWFTGTARERGLRATRLTASAYGSRARYRTGLLGWYLRPDRVLAVGEDAELYILTVPSSVRAWFTGVSVRPAEPRLVLGEGARDGERIALRELLQRRLDAGDAGPR
jgi:hypothetical protein